MDRYIGVDAHSSSCTLAVVSASGKRLATLVVETNARCLIEAVRQIPQPRHICLEEGTLSEWLYEVLSPHAEKVVVAAVRESHGPKDDRRDAFGLAEGLRLGAIRRKVYKERGGFGDLGYRAKGYRWVRGDGVRVKSTEEPVPLAGGAGGRARGLHGHKAGGSTWVDFRSRPNRWRSSCTRNWTRWRR
jgi:transposase